MDFITGTAQPPRFFIRFGYTLPDAVRRWFCTATVGVAKLATRCSRYRTPC